MTDHQQRTVDYLRVSVTDRCNLRCVYCMPPEGIAPVRHDEVLSYEEILRVCGCAAKLGVRKIKLTGGEPLTRKGIDRLIHGLKCTQGIEQVTLTTNGVLLGEQLTALAGAGLDAVNISLDTLDATRFEQITRKQGLAQVLESIDKAIALGLHVKINCLPVRELNSDQLVPLAGFAQSRPVDVRFIELMPIGGGKSLTPIPSSEVRGMLQAAYGALTPYAKKLGNGPAAYDSVDGFAGHIGFISAVSTGFCAQCNRVRLTSTGFLKLCLHYNKGVELRPLLRGGITDEDLTVLLRQEIQNKPVHHQFGQSGPDDERHSMAQIGG